MSEPIPTPGSPDARSRGCRCDMAGNAFGKGMYIDARGETIYGVRPDCPLHGVEKLAAPVCSETLDMFGDAK